MSKEGLYSEIEGLRLRLVTVSKERDELRYLHEQIADRVFPGEADSVDAMVEIVKERDNLRLELEELQAFIRLIGRN